MKPQAKRWIGVALVLASVGVAVWHLSSTPMKTHATPRQAIAAGLAEPGKTPSVPWVIDPSVTGDSLPPAGRSLFDFLTTREDSGQRVQEVPFPFTALTTMIEAGLARDGHSGLKQVLIPLGRSLQRTAAAPDFFAHPRVVVAVDSEPGESLVKIPPLKTSKASFERSGQKGGEGGFRTTVEAANSPQPPFSEGGSSTDIFLKDRLYLGYQEKADLIEVISYNEAAGRFEFQLVKDYRQGAKPKVFYANRAVCMSCHQNAAPIFSRQVWDETNANSKVAALLRRQGRDFHGVRVDRGVDVPYAIDNATDRANLLAAYQLLWAEGCGHDDIDAIRCRAALFTAVLQYQLTGHRQFDSGSAGYRDRAAARLAMHGRTRWPDGLAVGNPDIANRDPLPGEAGLALPGELLRATAGDGSKDSLAQRALVNLSNVAPAFDPLNPRPPLEVWSMSRLEDASRAVTGLAEFIAQQDVERLDARLFALGTGQGAARRTHRAACSVTQKPIAAGRQRVEFACAPAPGAPASVAMQGHVDMAGARVFGGWIDRLQLGAQGELRDIELLPSPVEKRPAEWRTALRLARDGMRVRGADGHSLEQIELTSTVRPRVEAGAATVTVREDFAPVERAVAAMVDDAVAGNFDGFSSRPFRRASLMPALFSRLGMKTATWCCLNDAGMPPPMLENFETQALTMAGAKGADPGAEADPKAAVLRPFYQHCAACHQTAGRFPPNFLAGTPEQVAANLAQCAERLFVRLSMWQLAPAARSKSAMPPAYALQREGYSAEVWRDGAELAALKGYVENTMKTQTGRAPRLDELAGRGYENLRPCLPGSG